MPIVSFGPSRHQMLACGPTTTSSTKATEAGGGKRSERSAR
jgi:hypothetical protein